jgi:hypothetical protein
MSYFVITGYYSGTLRRVQYSKPIVVSFKVNACLQVSIFGPGISYGWYGHFAVPGYAKPWQLV